MKNPQHLEIPIKAIQYAGAPGRDYAHRLARRGYVAFCIDDPVMGEWGKGIAGFDTRGFYKKHPGWTVVGKVAWDYARAMDTYY